MKTQTKLTNEWYRWNAEPEEKSYTIINIDYENKIVTMRNRFKKRKKEFITNRNIQFQVDTKINNNSICVSYGESLRGPKEIPAKTTSEQDMIFVSSLPDFWESLIDIFKKIRSVDNGNWTEFKVKKSDAKYYRDTSKDKEIKETLLNKKIEIYQKYVIESKKDYSIITVNYEECTIEVEMGQLDENGNGVIQRGYGVFNDNKLDSYFDIKSESVSQDYYNEKMALALKSPIFYECINDILNKMFIIGKCTWINED